MHIVINRWTDIEIDGEWNEIVASSNRKDIPGKQTFYVLAI
jgi:hypothetical protein